MTFTAPETESIAAQVEAFRRGRRDLDAAFAEIEDRIARHVDLNPIAWLDADRVRERIRMLNESASGDRPPGPSTLLSGRRLAGVFVSVKDLFAVPGAPLAAGTRAALPDVGAESTVVRRLVEAGAIVFAKTNMHEIALGATGENTWTGDVSNPYDPPARAAVRRAARRRRGRLRHRRRAARHDTGGSVRIPAAFCGVVGFKPTYGSIPLRGALPLSWTCDHAGPLARLRRRRRV